MSELVVHERRGEQGRPRVRSNRDHRARSTDLGLGAPEPGPAGLSLPTLYSELTEAALDQGRVEGLTHAYYKYPARLSPCLVRRAIELFTEPGGLVVDPFVGGGTTLVEAMALGRHSIGGDINGLARFVSTTKVALPGPLAMREINDAVEWFPDSLAIRSQADNCDWRAEGFLRNLECRETWRIRRAIGAGLAAADTSRFEATQAFLRCALLRAGQWALEVRTSTPSIEQFRAYVRSALLEMLAGHYQLREEALKNGPATAWVFKLPAERLALEITRRQEAPSMVLTSPPYPGVHILYHRWAVRGRRETAAPYWVAGEAEMNGESHYTMGHRAAHLRGRYWSDIRGSFSALRATLRPGTPVVQVVGFSSPEEQLPQYLEVMSQAGYIEAADDEARIWRAVPGRKWYSRVRTGGIGSHREVVLVHRAA